MKITCLSSFSGEFNTLEVDITLDQYVDWQNARDNGSYAFVQDHFPHLSEDIREFLISGVTPDEWDHLFGELPDDEEDS